MLCCLWSSENEEELSDIKRYERRIYQLYSDSLVDLIMEWISNVNSCCAGAVDTNRISAWQLLLSWHGWKESRTLIQHNDRPQISLAITTLVRSFDLKLEKKRGTNERRGRESEKDWQMMHAGSCNLIRAEDRKAMVLFVCGSGFAYIVKTKCLQKDSKTWNRPHKGGLKDAVSNVSCSGSQMWIRHPHAVIRDAGAGDQRHIISVFSKLSKATEAKFHSRTSNENLISGICHFLERSTAKWTNNMIDR